MADPTTLRVQRHRRHAAGDHSLCRRCVALRGEGPAAAPVVDPAAALRELAGRLVSAQVADPGNALLARELRMTLQAIPPEVPEDVFGELRGLAARVS